MSLFFNYAGTDLGNATIRLGTIQGLQESADNGNFSTCGIEVDDAAGALNLVGLKKFYVLEPDCTEPRVFSGYAAIRNIARGQNDSLRTGAARRWSVDLNDLNTIFGQRLLLSSASSRPAETDAARITWLLGNNWTPELHDNGFVNTASPVNLDAADYRGRYAGEVLNDCIGARGSTRLYFAYWDSAKNQASLFYDDPVGSTFSSTLRLTNVFADVDNSTTFSASGVLTRDPSQVYSTIWVPFSGGFVTATNAATATAFIPRDVAVPAPQIGKVATAQHYADLLATTENVEQDTIVVAVKLPSSKVNLVRAGQRVQIKFSHLPGYSAGYTYLRIVRRTVAQDEETTAFYNVTLELTVPRVSGVSGGVPSNTTVWPSQQPPFVPSPAGSYVSMLEADGATHIWPLSEAAGAAVDIMAGENGTYNNLHADMTRHVAGPGSIAGAFGVQVISAGTPASNVSIDDGGAQLPAANSDRSFEFWVKFVTVFLGAANFAYGTGLSSYNMIWSGTAGPNNIAVAGDSGMSVALTVPNAIGDGAYHCLTFTYDSATFTQAVYFDGALASSAAFAHALNTDVSAPSGVIFQSPPSNYVQSYSSAAPVKWTAAQIVNHALGDAGAAATSSTVPSVGQPISAESATGDGTTVAYTANYPYAAGSTEVHVDGELVTVTETTPTSGIFTFAVAPPLGATIVWTYNATSPTTTGAAHPAPTAAFIGSTQTIAHLINKSGGSVAAGDVVVIDTGNSVAFTTTTTSRETKLVGIAQAAIASNARGPVLMEGYAPLVNTTASVTRGNYAQTSTTVKKATENATRQSGSFAQYLTGGTTPDAFLFGVPDSAAGGGSTSPLTTKGDVWGFSSVDARIPIGTNGQVLTADSTQTLGLKWAASGGGGGSTIQYPALKPGSLNGTYGDDFAAASLDGKWTARQNSGTFTTARVFTQGVDGSHVGISMSQASGFIYEAGPAGDFEFHVGNLRMTGFGLTVDVWPGITILDSTGTGVCVALDNDGNMYALNMTSYKYDNGGAIGTVVTGAVWNSDPWWMRITKVGTTYDFYASASGYAWDYHSNATKTSAITVAYLGIGDMKGTMTTRSSLITADYVNKV